MRPYQLTIEMISICEEHLLNYLKKRCQENWLIGYDSHEFYQLTERYYQKILSEKPINVFLVEENYFEFMAVFLAAVATNCPIFLCNPDWQKNEWEQVLNLVQPDLILSRNQQKLTQISSYIDFARRQGSTAIEGRHGSTAPTIMIPTGGSSGKIRFAIHTWATLTASVKGFYEYFKPQSVNSFCLLPLYHVSGLMQFLRSFLTGGKFKIMSYQILKQQIDDLSNSSFNNQEYFISLVPTQLQFFLQISPLWLSKFLTVLLGGAPAWLSLLEQARQFEIKLAPTYGMTETASQIVTLKPEDFLKGNNSSGQVLPHAKVSLTESQLGAIAIQADSLFLGYYGEKSRQNQIFYTDDMGQFDKENYLYILGRNSQKIISGGENVYPFEIEAAILETQLVKDVAVIGLPHPYWGEIVTAIYVPQTQELLIETLKTALQNKLSKYKIPKDWIGVATLPRNQQGKLNYQKLQEIYSRGQKTEDRSQE